MNLIGLISVAFGIYSICGAVLNWNFYMEAPQARFFAKIFGRDGTRIFYVLFGLGFLVFGVLITLGIIMDAS